MSTATVGLLVPIAAKSDTAIVEFLGAGYEIAQTEPETLHWFAVKYTSESAGGPQYAVFDTFAAESGRNAHVNGKIPEAMAANGAALFSADPVIQKLDILTSLVRPATATAKTAGLGVGLLVSFTAKENQVDAVRKFLISAIPLVEAEDGTLAWYAVAFPGTNNFAVVDFFADDAGRDAHVAGKVAAALFGSADELLIATPKIIKLDVLAAKI